MTRSERLGGSLDRLVTVVIKVKVIFEKLGIFFINKKCNDAFSHIRSKSLKLVRSNQGLN